VHASEQYRRNNMTENKRGMRIRIDILDVSKCILIGNNNNNNNNKGNALKMIYFLKVIFQ